MSPRNHSAQPSVRRAHRDPTRRSRDGGGYFGDSAVSTQVVIGVAPGHVLFEIVSFWDIEWHLRWDVIFVVDTVRGEALLKDVCFSALLGDLSVRGQDVACVLRELAHGAKRGRATRSRELSALITSLLLLSM